MPCSERSRIAGAVFGLIRQQAIGLTLSGAVLLTSASVVAAQYSQSIVAIVNEDAISQFDIDSRLAMLTSMSSAGGNRAITPRLREQVLESLIDESLQTQEAERLNISVRAEEIDAAIQNIERQNQLPPGSLSERFATAGVDIRTLRRQLEAGVAWRKVIRQRIRPQVEVGDDEIDDVIAEIQSAGGTSEYRVAEIFIAADGPEEMPSAFSTIEGLIDQLRAGVPFAALAQQFSQASSAGLGGDIGIVRTGQLDPRLENALEQLQPGQISQPIQTETGFYLLLLRDLRQIEAPKPEDALVRLRRIFLALPENATPADIQAQMSVAREVGASVRDCEDMERVAKQVDSQQSVDIGEIRVGDLPGDLRNAVATLAVDTASEPVQLRDGIILLMICERTEAAGSLPDRDNILRQLSEQRVAVRAGRYLRDLRQAAYIDIRK